VQYLTYCLSQTTSKQSKKIKTALDGVYSYLAAGAFGRDKKGRVTKDDAAMTADLAAAGLGVGEGNEFTAFVYYEFEV
jgi:V-type H+-transporting ATPase subunit C